MAGKVASYYFCQELNEELKYAITKSLGNIAQRCRPSKRGIHLEIEANDRPFLVQIYKTEDNLEMAESELDKYGDGDYNSYPTFVSFAAMCNQKADEDWLLCALEAMSNLGAGFKVMPEK